MGVYIVHLNFFPPPPLQEIMFSPKDEFLHRLREFLTNHEGL